MGDDFVMAVDHMKPLLELQFGEGPSKAANGCAMDVGRAGWMKRFLPKQQKAIFDFKKLFLGEFLDGAG